ncbi:hypothetical protein [uncultured Rikenella sp.]|uniref:hypothetical protein n=1 Tax=uncultured Rikenella sp. TaxID=368003 RepID=UPI002623DE8B|nr:hypothetical protein [uncultured Rikenella sp.]
MKKLIPHCLLLFLTACGGTPTTDSTSNRITDPMLASKDFFFSGDYVYYADAAVLTDCATGITLPIAQTGDNLNVERRYTALPGPEMLPCYATLEGYLRPGTKDNAGERPELVITRFKEFDTTRHCTPKQRLTGRYIDKTADTTSRQVTLELHSDYTYKLTTHNIPANSYGISEGHWGRLSESVVVFMVPNSANMLATINWEGPELVLSENSAFVKVN